ncbi:MAG: DUF2510 domain-containing protein [Acidimicrobiia bacterium]
MTESRAPATLDAGTLDAGTLDAVETPAAPTPAAPTPGAAGEAVVPAPLDDLPPPPGWYPDPLAPDRTRQWDGGGWTPAIRTEGPPPKRRKDPPSEPIEGISWVPWLTMLGPPAKATRVPRRRRPGALAVVGATLAVLLAAVAGGAILPGEDQRPALEPTISYDDPAAGFALRYPNEWEVLRRDEGEGIRFAVAAPDASAADTNTVSVAVGATSAELPPLHTLADELTQKLRTELPGVELRLAERAQVAGATALRFTFRDSGSGSPTRIEQWVGRTTAGRPLTITVTVREPRTAPSADELAEFIDSVESP